MTRVFQHLADCHQSRPSVFSLKSSSNWGSSLVVQWLKLCTSTAGDDNSSKYVILNVFFYQKLISLNKIRLDFRNNGKRSLFRDRITDASPSRVETGSQWKIHIFLHKHSKISILGWGTKILHAAWHGQKSFFFKKIKLKWIHFGRWESQSD